MNHRPLFWHRLLQRLWAREAWVESIPLPVAAYNGPILPTMYDVLRCWFQQCKLLPNCNAYLWKIMQLPVRLVWFEPVTLGLLTAVGYYINFWRRSAQCKTDCSYNRIRALVMCWCVFFVIIPYISMSCWGVACLTLKKVGNHNRIPEPTTKPHKDDLHLTTIKDQSPSN